VIDKLTCVLSFFCLNDESEGVRNGTHGYQVIQLNELLVDDGVNGSDGNGDECLGLVVNSPRGWSHRDCGARTNIRVIKRTTVAGQQDEAYVKNALSALKGRNFSGRS
jgi:hypothetical protein